MCIFHKITRLYIHFLIHCDSGNVYMCHNKHVSKRISATSQHLPHHTASATLNVCHIAQVLHRTCATSHKCHIEHVLHHTSATSNMYHIAQVPHRTCATSRKCHIEHVPHHASATSN